MPKLVQILSEWKTTLVRQSLTSLSEARLPHYVREKEGELHRRLDTLLAQTLQSLQDKDATPLVEHIAHIAQERFEAGYDLSEVQTSINVLEEVLWQRTLSSLAPEDVAGALGKLNAIFSVAKDKLAQTYVALAADPGSRTGTAKPA